MRQLLTQSERRPEDALVRHELTHCLLTWRKCIIKRIIAMTVILPHAVLPNASAATLLPSERHPVAARSVLPAPLLLELSKLLARLPVQDDAEALRKSLFHAGTHFNPDLLTSEAERRARLEGVHAALDRAESLVFLDTESTGGRNGRLIEVGLVETDVEQNITGGLHFRCNPHRRSQARARRVHGIQDCELEHCPEFAARADELLETVRGKTVVIHDRTMDLLWLNRELQAARPGAPRFEDCCTVIDSFVLARAVPSERRRNGLDALLEWYGLGARGGHHDAYGDAALLSRIFFELWWDLDEWLYGE